METGKRGLQEASNPRGSKRRKKERKYALLSGWGEDEEQWKTTELEAKTTWNPGGQENHQVDSVVEVGDQEEPRTGSPPKETKDPGHVPEDDGERPVLSNTPPPPSRRRVDILFLSSVNSGSEEHDPVCIHTRRGRFRR